MDSYKNWECGATIMCPYCKTEYEPSYEETYIGHDCVDCYEDGKKQEFVCDSCGRRFTVTPNLTWEYETETIEGEMSEEEWEEEFG